MIKQKQGTPPNSRNDENISPGDLGGGPQDGVDGAPIDEDDDIPDPHEPAVDADDDVDDDEQEDAPLG